MGLVVGAPVSDSGCGPAVSCHRWPQLAQRTVRPAAPSNSCSATRYRVAHAGQVKITEAAASVLTEIGGAQR